MQRLFDIKKTQLEMVRDRGYDISPEEIPIFTHSLADFIAYYTDLATALRRAPTRSLLSRSYTAKKADGTQRLMLVYYGGKTNPQQKQVSADVVRDFIGTIQRYAINEAILIVDAPLSSTGDNELKALVLTKWQVFFDNELTYNPTTRSAYSQHELLSPEEKIAKLAELKVGLSDILIMKATDPVAKYFGWSLGDLIRLHRHDTEVSILTPKSINYRIVVA